MSAARRSSWRRPRRVSDEVAARDLFHLAIGVGGALVGITTGLLVGTTWLERWTTVAAPLSGAICALLLYNLVGTLLRRRGLAAVLARVGLLGLNAVFFVVEVLLLVVTVGGGEG